MSEIDFTPHAAKIAAELLGEPNKRLSKKDRPRYGTNGSLEVNLSKATFYDYEQETGGGLLDLIERVKGFRGRAAFDWMREIGCEVPEADDQPRPNGNGADHAAAPPRIVKEYNYVSEDGDLIFQVVRMEPKTFRQRQPDGDAWKWTVKGLRQVPYRLPELLEAVSADRTIFIVEGEKDADNLARLGVPATTNAGGAGKWSDELNQFFAGAAVVLLADNDEPGRKHIDKIGAGLREVAREVRVLELPNLPPKGDVSDWIAAGGTVEQLHDLVARAPAWGETPAKPQRFRLIPFGEVALSPRPRYLIRGLIPRTGLVVIWGPPKCGKSFWTYDWSMHVALGIPYRGRRTEQGAVVYLVLEGDSGFADRVEAYRQRRLAHHREPVPFYELPTRIDLVADHVVLISDIRLQLGDVRPAVVVIDTLNRSLRGSESSDQDMGAYVKAADAIREAFDCVVPIVHHCGIEAARPRGHSSLTGAADAQISVRRDTDKNVVVTVEYMKDGPEGDRILSRLEKVEIGREPDGAPITSCVVEPLGTDEAAASKNAAFKVRDTQSAPGETLFRALMQALDERGVVPPAGLELPRSVAKVVEYKHVRDIFRRKMLQVDEDPRKHEENLKKQLQRAGAPLKKFGLIGAEHPWVWWTGRAVRGDRGLIAGPPAELATPPDDRPDLPDDTADLLANT